MEMVEAEVRVAHVQALLENNLEEIILLNLLL
jgi:hypothetical protein